MSSETDSIPHEEPSVESLQEIPPLPPDAREARPRGYYAKRARQRHHWVAIDDELRELFPTEKAVNAALRKVAELFRQMTVEHK